MEGTLSLSESLCIDGAIRRAGSAVCFAYQDNADIQAVRDFFSQRRIPMDAVVCHRQGDIGAKTAGPLSWMNLPSEPDVSEGKRDDRVDGYTCRYGALLALRVGCLCRGSGIEPWISVARVGFYLFSGRHNHAHAMAWPWKMADSFYSLASSGRPLVVCGNHCLRVYRRPAPLSGRGLVGGYHPTDPGGCGMVEAGHDWLFGGRILDRRTLLCTQACDFSGHRQAVRFRHHRLSGPFYFPSPSGLPGRHPCRRSVQ